jgi:thymidine phosphorylase
MRSIRAKMYGQLNYEALQNIINDIVKANIPILKLQHSLPLVVVTTHSGNNRTHQSDGNFRTKPFLDKKMVVDKHCVGGLPGTGQPPS